MGGDRVNELIKKLETNTKSLSQRETNDTIRWASDIQNAS